MRFSANCKAQIIQAADASLERTSHTIYSFSIVPSPRGRHVKFFLSITSPPGQGGPRQKDGGRPHTRRPGPLKPGLVPDALKRRSSTRTKKAMPKADALSQPVENIVEAANGADGPLAHFRAESSATSRPDDPKLLSSNQLDNLQAVYSGFCGDELAIPDPIVLHIRGTLTVN